MGLFDRLFGTKKEVTKKEEDMPLTAEVVEEQVEAKDSNKQEDLQDSDSSLHDNAALFEPLLESEPLPSEHSETLLTEAQEDSEESDAALAAMEDYYRRKADLEKQLVEQTSEEELPQVGSDEGHDESDEDKYERSLSKTRTGFAARLNSFFANFRRVDEEFFEELEEMLILSDVGVTVATQLTEALRQEAKLENAKKPEALKRLIIEKLVDIYEKDGIYNEKINYQDDLTVMLFVGVNGVGKTTSIGKLAYRYKAEGKKVMLVAADTFRAGAVAQLSEWGRRVAVPVVTGPEKADPASVVFDGMEKAVAEKVDILLIDTAGRLQNKENLMAELEKMGRIIKRVLPDAPHETLLALDASTGQNALSQAKEFSKILPLTGLILTKIDGSAKGGVVLAIRQDLDIPVKFIGFGEKIDDIGEFQSEDFMRGLLGDLL
ncbi:signal recognition particle-docking protein FtsY [Streptococcus iniae]|uniref:signal recognition particle-docking protein FtsY n=1 Tax=Streptococcus iniae TaxID=1346 RepID=UPI0008DAD7F1|nr:signal recognition particle-docking protein FtsY [Streptococcus iniae]OHX27282.1 signal recognition particle-docking protein FtsY [Streptococcus iniae]RLV27554.1 signal recognition particle-docking protein FtsY [Streptococcus iniae]